MNRTYFKGSWVQIKFNLKTLFHYCKSHIALYLFFYSNILKFLSKKKFIFFHSSLSGKALIQISVQQKSHTAFIVFGAVLGVYDTRSLGD